jgi:hypothetical protein
MPRNMHTAIEFGARPGTRDVSMQAHFLTSRLLAGVHHVRDEHVSFYNGLKKLAKIAGANGFPRCCCPRDQV